MRSDADICILGAGLAGISLASELIDAGLNVSILDPRGIAGGASGTPIGLVNPATGRYATLGWRSEECYQSVLENLEMVQSGASVPFFKKTGVLRPALDQKIASKMKENYESTEWPEGWCEWMDEKSVIQFHPAINCVGGGVWLPIGLTVDISTYLQCFADHLEKKGVRIFTGSTYQLSQEDKIWKISFDKGSSFYTKKVVICAGIYSKELSHFREIPLIPVKGQLAVFKTNSSLKFDHSVSALGYIGSLSSDVFVAGSTYEHKFDNKMPDEKGLEYLKARLGSVLPDLIDNATLINQWSGIRASTPNRKPILGEHPDHTGLFIFAGLGSKGLLYSAYLSRLMASFMLKDKPLPKELSIQRFY